MGGKTKQVQRTKNNVKPANSARSAELLGNAANSFVGFSVHADLGLVPILPGFELAEQSPEMLESHVSAEVQLLLRKLCKKDPITKKKALQEFIAHIQQVDADALKPVLPLWPKYYQGLALDTEHNIRELAQSVLQLLMEKCKRSMAPYLKQLVPMLLASQFDAYQPAATLASNIFNGTFTTEQRRRDVCLHCQLEMVNFYKRNLTFHTADTLSSNNSLTPEEAEQKYQRLVVGSLKALTFFMQQVTDQALPVNLLENLEQLFKHSKFMSYAKHKIPNIKSAWFELIEQILHHVEISGFLKDLKSNLVDICVQNIDEQNALVAPHVWNCFLMLQHDENWYKTVNFRKLVLSKLSVMLKNIFKNPNLQIMCRNLLPFLSHISPECLGDMTIEEFDQQFFTDLKQAIEKTNVCDNKDIECVISAYFECLRYRLSKMHTKTNELNHSEFNYAKQLVSEFIMKPIQNMLQTPSTQEEKTRKSQAELLKTSCFFRHTAEHMAYFGDRRNKEDNNDLYAVLLHEFWTCLFEMIEEAIKEEDQLSVEFVQRICNLLHDLYFCDPKLEKAEASVTFAVDEMPSTSTGSSHKRVTSIKHILTPSHLCGEMKRTLVQLVLLCLRKVQEGASEQSFEYIAVMRKLTQIFSDSDFYLQLTDKHDLLGAAECFVLLLDDISKFKVETVELEEITEPSSEPDWATDFETEDDLESDTNKENEPLKEEDNSKNNIKEAEETILDIIFEILSFVDQSKRYAYINEHLLTLNNNNVQTMIMYRLLSYPHCVEPELRKLMTQDIAKELLCRLARDFIDDNDSQKLIIVEKCFFQDEAGDILIDADTVDRVVEIISEPLIQAEHAVVEQCASFIAQIIPILCAPNTCSKRLKLIIFTKLFYFTVENICSQVITDDTYLEVASSWQDALSSSDIKISDELLQECADIVHQKLLSATQSDEADALADIVAKFVLCSTEQLAKQSDALNSYMRQLDFTCSTFFQAPAAAQVKVDRMLQQCLLLEAIQGLTTPMPALISQQSVEPVELLPIFQSTLINMCALLKLICGNDKKRATVYSKNIDAMPSTSQAATHDSSLSEQESTEDFYDASEHVILHITDTLNDHLLQCLVIAAVGESLLQMDALALSEKLQMVILELSERVKKLMRKKDEVAQTLMKRMLQTLQKTEQPALSRALMYVLDSEIYLVYEDNASTVLLEELGDALLEHKAFASYAHCLQYLLVRLPAKALTLDAEIMRQTPNELWVRAAVFRAYVSNLKQAELMSVQDKNVYTAALQFLTDTNELHLLKNNVLLSSKCDLITKDYEMVINTVEYMNLLRVCIEQCPYELTVKHWDSVRIGLGNWVLIVSNSVKSHPDPKVAIFTVSVYKLFAVFNRFLNAERQKSSTNMLKMVMDEWDALFAKDINFILLTSFYRLCTQEDNLTGGPELARHTWLSMLHEITPVVESIDYKLIYQVFRSKQDEEQKMMPYFLDKLSCDIKRLAFTSMYILREMSKNHIPEDHERIVKKTDSELEPKETLIDNRHLLTRFEHTLLQYAARIDKYVQEFSFKLTQIADFQAINEQHGYSFLLIWELLIDLCAAAPMLLRAVYISWIQAGKYEDKFLHFLFRAMPADVLKNYDSKSYTTDVFQNLTWEQLNDPAMSLEKYASYLYGKVLRKLPAAVRKWWNLTASRQKTFIDKLTTVHISTLICNEELRTIASKKDKHENMQITVHTSTREVLAVYSIDEVRMELVISLANNYPLGPMKVECGKQLGGRANSRNVGMQLTIFLTHQNGTILDGLSMWKENLDKKFSGVEECYICYTVIHQETCQLPKLSCKTCRKKFHGPCLYKWFTTSSKSTCPMCRNIF